MNLRRVVNASPIIFLDRVGLLDQLNEPGVTVLAPDSVLQELGGLAADDPAAVAVQSASWIQVVAAPPVPGSLRLFRLDPGIERTTAIHEASEDHGAEAPALSGFFGRPIDLG